MTPSRAATATTQLRAGGDRLPATLIAGQTIESIATQVGVELLLNFGDQGQVLLVGTTLADLAGVDVLAN